MTEEAAFTGFVLLIMVNVFAIRLIRYTFTHHNDGFKELEEKARREGHHQEKDE